MKSVLGFIGFFVGLGLLYVIFWLFFHVTGALGGFMFGVGKYQGENAEYWYSQYDEANSNNEDLQKKIEDLQSSLDEANSHIDDANDQIETAKYNSRDSYEEMNDSLDSLETVSKVYDPTM
jgi:hypothetical protein